MIGQFVFRRFILFQKNQGFLVVFGGNIGINQQRFNLRFAGIIWIFLYKVHQNGWSNLIGIPNFVTQFSIIQTGIFLNRSVEFHFGSVFESIQGLLFFIKIKVTFSQMIIGILCYGILASYNFIELGNGVFEIFLHIISIP